MLPKMHIGFLEGGILSRLVLFCWDLFSMVIEELLLVLP